MKKALTEVEGALVVEDGRTFTATVLNLGIPDEHYSLSKAPFSVTFLCSDPFAVSTLLTATTPVPSGLTNFSGMINISGTFFARPTITYTPPSAVGNTFMKTMTLTHTPTSQQVTISGFGSGAGLSYQNSVTINMDDFTSSEGSSLVNNTGAFPRWDPGINQFVVSVSGRFLGGFLTVSYQPRYL